MVNENLFTQKLVTGEKVTLQNVGSGVGVVARKDDVGFAIRTIKSGAGILVRNIGEDIVITNTGALRQSFLDIAEAPADWTGANAKFLSFNAATGRLEFIDVPADHGAFTDLSDVPSSYTGMDGRVLTVDEANNEVVWTDLVGTYVTPISNRVTTTEAAITLLQEKKESFVSETAPTDAVEGNIWFKASDGSLYVLYGDPGVWVEVGASEPAIPTPKNYDYGGSFEGTPTSNQVIYRWRPPTSHTFRDEFAGCVFACDTAPHSTFSCKIYVNGVYVGDWHISTARNSTLVTTATEVVVPAGAEVKVVAPLIPVTGISGITMTFQGVLQ